MELKALFAGGQQAFRPEGHDQHQHQPQQEVTILDRIQIGADKLLNVRIGYRRQQHMLLQAVEQSSGTISATTGRR